MKGGERGDHTASRQPSTPATNRFTLGGASSGIAVTTLANISDSAATTGQDTPRILVFAYGFWPQIPFTVVGQLQTDTTIKILTGPENSGLPEIPQPDEWNGYLINYEVTDTENGYAVDTKAREGFSGLFTLVFTETSLRTDRQYQFSGDATVFSTRLNLLANTESTGSDSQTTTKAPTTTTESTATETQTDTETTSLTTTDDRG